MHKVEYVLAAQEKVKNSAPSVRSACRRGMKASVATEGGLSPQRSIKL